MKFSNIAAALVAACLACSAQASPISYEGTLSSGVTTGGWIAAPGGAGSPHDDYWQFSGTAGQVISITVNRLTAALDPGFNLFEGAAADTLLLGANLAVQDDDIAALPGFSGPYFDPQLLNFILPTTGLYTLQVWSVASGPQPQGGFMYQVTLNGAPEGQVFNGQVPEPSGLALAALALLAAAGAARQLRARQPRN